MKLFTGFLSQHDFGYPRYNCTCCRLIRNANKSYSRLNRYATRSCGCIDSIIYLQRAPITAAYYRCLLDSNPAGGGAVTSIATPVSGWGNLILHAWRRSSSPPSFRFSPYVLSPTTGCPIEARCALTWCVRPVRSSTVRRALPGVSGFTTRYSLTAFFPFTSGRVTDLSPFLVVRGMEMVPRCMAGTPSTTARYVFSMSPPANALLRILATGRVFATRSAPVVCRSRR